MCLLDTDHLLFMVSVVCYFRSFYYIIFIAPRRARPILRVDDLQVVYQTVVCSIFIGVNCLPYRLTSDEDVHV